MKVVFVSSEMVPFAKTGGLADMVGSLAKEIRLLDHEVIAFAPRYKSIDPESWGLRTAVDRLEVPIGTEKEVGRIFSHTLDSGVIVYLVDHPEFFSREGLYGTALGDYPDNDRRFIFFQRAVLESLRILNFKPEVIHCHDWQSGLIPVYLKTLYAGDPVLQKTRSIFTIHNLAYQVNFPPDSLPATGLDWNQFKMERLEFYGKISFMKGGILDADSVTTVSERYAAEIQTHEFGCGMEGVIERRKSNLFGIVNGIDLEEWDPEKDRDIEVPYGPKKLEKKGLNKTALQKENGFEENLKVPVIGVISRLVDQKGMDILIPAIPQLLKAGAQFVLLGTGEEKYHQVLRDLAKKNKHHCAMHILFDTQMAKRIYAGADMMLFPSYYEPCGLGQMIALRFATIPVVRATGGLADTIQEFNQGAGNGNGFLFEEYSTEALLTATNRAIEAFRRQEHWTTLMKNALLCDFSWTASAKKYLKLYGATKRRAIEGLGK